LSKTTGADVEIGNADFSVACWVYLNSKAARQMIVAKDVSGAREYILYYESSSDRFGWQVVDEGSVLANNLGPPATGTWYCVTVWYVAASHTLGISVNDGTADTSSFAGSAAATTAQFRIGARAFSGFEDYMDGGVDAVHIWKRVLTSGERTEFYNSGTGIEFSASGSSDLVIQDASHAHMAVSLTLTQDHNLITQNASHDHAATNITLSQAHALAVHDASHTHSAQNAVLTQAHSLTIQDATHSHVAESLILAQLHVLATQGVSHAHTAEALVLTQVHSLAVQNGTHGHNAENVALIMASSLIAQYGSTHRGVFGRVFSGVN
jgi:hypothetical protein